jgi:uncharacterized membrane protein YgaE (UPF0421/DUF939 family)
MGIRGRVCCRTPGMIRSKMLTWLHMDLNEVLQPEAYWAAVTAIVIMQSTLGAAWTVSKQRFGGTALGAAMGALLAAYAAQNVAAFGPNVFLLGLICAVFRNGRNASQYAGITLAIVMLIARAEPAWMIGIHRFLEISVGIAAGLLLTAVWPEPEPASSR